MPEQHPLLKAPSAAHHLQHLQLSITPAVLSYEHQVRNSSCIPQKNTTEINLKVLGDPLYLCVASQHHSGHLKVLNMNIPHRLAL